MTESIQRILARRALAGQTPASASELIEWLEATARAWNADPTPFEWGGKRQLRRQRAYRRRHPARRIRSMHAQTRPMSTRVHEAMAGFLSSERRVASQTAGLMLRPAVQCVTADEAQAQPGHGMNI